jgi:hypothetical protein
MLTSWRRILTVKALALSLVGLAVILGIAIRRQRQRGSALPITPPATDV